MARIDEDFDHDITDMVETWLINDGDYYFQAQGYARRGTDELSSYVASILSERTWRNEFAKEVADELAPNDYDRIDWSQIAETLLAE